MKANKIDFQWKTDFSIYSSEKYLKLVGNEYGWLGGFDDVGALRCILPYTIVHKALVRMVRFRVETIPMDEELSIEDEKEFLNSCAEYFRSIGADMIIPATTNTIFRTYPDNAQAAPYGTYIVDLTLSEETLWAKLHSKHRNVIRNAQKKGVEILSGLEYLKIAHETVRDTLQRSNMGFISYEELEKLASGLGENLKVFVAKHEETIQGCAIYPFSKYCAYYLYGGSISHPLSGAMNLLQWEAMRAFQKDEVKKYDFVGVRINPEKGSKAEGLASFKERFGGYLAQGYIWKLPISKMKYALYSQAVRQLRGGDIVDQEHHKLKDSVSV